MIIIVNIWTYKQDSSIRIKAEKLIVMALSNAKFHQWW